MSWAEVKKINSDMNKPLDDLLDEQVSQYIGNNDLIQGGSSIKTLLGNLWSSIQSKFGKFIGSYSRVRNGVVYNGNSVSISGKGKVKISFSFPRFSGALPFTSASYLSYTKRFYITVDGKQLDIFPVLASSSNSTDYGYSEIFSLDIYFESSFVLSVAAAITAGSNDCLINYAIDLISWFC